MLRDLIKLILLIYVSIRTIESPCGLFRSLSVNTEYTFGYVCSTETSRVFIQGVSGGGINIVLLADNDPNISEHYSQLLSNVLVNLDEYFTDRYGKDYYGKAYYRVGMCLYSDVAAWTIGVNGGYNPPISDYIIQSHDTEFNGTKLDHGFQAVEQELSIFADDVSFAPSMCILLTTSLPHNTSLAAAAAKSLKDSGVNIIVIVVGDDVAKKDVDNLASNDKAVFTTGQTMSYSENEIQNQAEDVTKALNTTLQHAHILPKYKWCYEAAIDIFMVIDVKQYHAQTLTQLIDFAVELNVDYASVQTLMINSPMEDKSFEEHVRSVLVTARETKHEVFGSEYNLSYSIRFAQKKLLSFDQSCASIAHLREKLLLVATDGSGRHIDDVIVESRACQESGIHIMALGVGTDVLEDQLSKIITDQRGIAIVTNYDDFGFGLRKLYSTLCAGVCHKGWVYYDGMSFKLLWETLPWSSAQKKCGDLKAKLVSITSANKYRWLKAEFVNNNNIHDPIHIGLRKHTLTSSPISSQFRWENGKPLVFSDW